MHLFDQVGDLGALLLVSCRDFQSQQMTQSISTVGMNLWNPFCAYGRRNPRGLFALRGWTEGFVNQRITAEGSVCLPASNRSTYLRRSWAMASKQPALNPSV